MPVSTKTGRGGLLTDPNKLLGVDALVRADNVYAESEGVLRVRPGFGQQTVKSTTRRPRRMWRAFGGALLPILSIDGSTSSLETLSGTISGTVPTPTGSTLMLADACDARGNWYVTTSSGVAKLTSSADTSLELAGLRRALTGLLALQSTGVPQAVANNKAVAYRWCIVRTDGGGMVIRSEPSPWQVITNTSGGTRDVFITIPLAADVAAGDLIEVYRTQSVVNTATPSDECFLALSYTVVSGDVSATYVEVADQTPETMLSRALYTNPTREGILRANTRPPIASQLALFASCLWYGCYSSAPQSLATIVSVERNDSDALIAQGDTVTTVSGSAVITMNPSYDGWSGLRVGLYVWDDTAGNPEDAGTTIPANTTLLSWDQGAGTITVSNNASTTEVARVIYISDRVTIDGVHYYTRSENTAQTRGLSDERVFIVIDSATAGDCGRAARNLAFTVSHFQSSILCVAIEEAGSRTGTLVCERESANGSSITITTTSPRGIRATSGASTITSETMAANTVMYSKPDEPEHVPALNFIALGSQSNRVVRLISLNGALLAWTTEGLYRITGAAPDQWRVDLVDREARLLRGELCDVMHGECYAVTSRGLVSADANGVGSMLSAGLVQRELEEYLPSIEDAPEDHDDGLYLACWPSRGLVLIGLTDGSADAANTVLAYAVSARAWSTWTLTHRWMTQTAQGMRALRAGSLWEARLAQDANVAVADSGYDRSYTSLTWTANGTTTVTITSANAGTWTPTAGDWLSANNGAETLWRRILTVDLAGGTYTLTLDATLAASYSTSRTAYEGIGVRLQYHALSPWQAVIAREAQLSLDMSDYATTDAATLTDMRISGGAGTEYRADLITSVTAQPTRLLSRSQRVRFGMPRNVARAQHLYVSVAFSEIAIRRLAIEGLSVVLSQAGERGVSRG